jgi:hypothetical protein
MKQLQHFHKTPQLLRGLIEKINLCLFDSPGIEKSISYNMLTKMLPKRAGMIKNYIPDKVEY